MGLKAEGPSSEGLVTWTASVGQGLGHKGATEVITGREGSWGAEAPNLGPNKHLEWAHGWELSGLETSWPQARATVLRS